jgi:hypothetical protein
LTEEDPMLRTIMSLAIIVGGIGCGVEDPSPHPGGSADAATGKGGSSSKAGTGGTAITTSGSGGTTSVAGSSVAGSAGSGGGAAGESADASTEDAPEGDGFDGRVPFVPCDGGTTYAGMSLHLDGAASYATLPRPVQDDFTFEAWIKTTTSLTGNEFWQGVGLFHADVQGGNNDFGASILNDDFAFGEGLGPGLNDVTMQSSSPVTSGDWTHVAVTRKESTGEVTLIVNGMTDNRQTYSQTSPLSASATLTIGGNTIDGHYFSGDIDELRIWNIVRSPADIASMMNKKLTGNETGLVGYYKFDDTGTGTAVDSSPSKVNLTFMGQATKATSGAPICEP